MTFTWDEKRHLDVDIGQIVSEVIACRKLGESNDDEVIDNCLTYIIPDGTPNFIHEAVITAIKEGLNKLPQRDFQKEFEALVQDAKANGWTPAWHNPFAETVMMGGGFLEYDLDISDFFSFIPPSDE